MADKPTVSVVKDSVDEKVLRAQYGDTINYTYGENQFVGNQREDTNQAYQRYLANAGVKPINLNVNPYDFTGVPVQYGKLVGGYDEASAIGNIQNSLQGSADSYLASQKAGLEQILNNSITTLSKAYEDAIADGSISVRQAQTDFAERKKELEKQAYAQAEVTRLYGNQIGISNSQQMAGLMAGDNARANANVQTAMSDRDKRVADISDRMNVISKQRNLDISAAQKEYDLGLLKASGEANRMVSDGLLGIQVDSLNANRAQGFNEKNIATQYGYDLEKMDKQQILDLAKMDKQFAQSLQLENIQYSHQAALQSARTQAEINAANNKAAMELEASFKAYGVNPNDPNALQQLRTKQNQEVFQGKVGSETASAAALAQAQSILNHPALNNGFTTAPTKKDTGNFFIDKILNWGYDQKKANYDANKTAQDAVKRYLVKYGIEVD